MKEPVMKCSCSITVSLVLLAFAPPSLAQNVPVICGFDVGGVCVPASLLTPAIPPVDTTKALVLFIQFDNPPAGNSCWNDWPAGSLPTWAPGIIRSSTSDLPAGSLNHYFNVMSRGKHLIYGDYHPQLIQLERGMCYYPGLATGLDSLAHRVIELADAQGVNFANYDVNNDGYVDKLILIYRNWGSTVSECPSPWNFAGISTLACAQHAGEPGWVFDGKTFDTAYPGSGMHCFGENQINALATVAHEYMHHVFVRETPMEFLDSDFHAHWLSCYGLMDGTGAGISLSAFERDKLGWITPTVVTSDATAVLVRDAITTGDAVKVLVNAADPDEFFLIENRQRRSYYELLHGDGNPQLETCNNELESTGLLIYHVDRRLGSTWSSVRKECDIEAADGMFTNGLADPRSGKDDLDGSVSSAPDALADTVGTDSFSPQNGNTFAPYSDPSTQGYFRDPVTGAWDQSVNTGIHITNVRYDPADPTETAMLFDIDFTTPSQVDTIFASASWSGHMDLVSDVSVASGATLSAAPGTQVRVRPNFDADAAGTNPLLTEIRVLSGGTLAMAGTQLEPVKISSAVVPPEMDDWYGVSMLAGGRVSLDYCDISYASYGVTASPSPALFSLRNSRMHHNGVHGVKVHATSGLAEMTACEVDSNGYSGAVVMKKLSYLTTTFSSKLTNCNIHHNGHVAAGSSAVEFLDFGGGSAMADTLLGCELSDSGGNIGAETGVYLSRVGGGVGGHIAYIRDSEITGFAQRAIFADKVASLSINNCTLRSTGTVLQAEGSSIKADSSLFEGRVDLPGADHVNVESSLSSTICLGQEYGPDPCGSVGCNTLVGSTGEPSVVNNDVDRYVMAEWNHWSPAPAWLVGFVDDLPQYPSPCGGAGQGALSNPFSTSWTDSEGEAAERSSESHMAIVPNPFHPHSSFRCAVPATCEGGCHVSLRLYDVRGSLVRSLVGRVLPPGIHAIAWDGISDSGEEVPAGIYLARLEIAARQEAAKIVLSR